MHRVLIAYITFDGHTTRIADRMADAIRGPECAVDVCDIAREKPQRPVSEYVGVIVGGPLHGGKHAPKLSRFVSDNLLTLNEHPSAFFSVSLSAAGTQEQQADATRCVNAFLEETGWHPLSTSIIAGALLYREYGFFKRWMMKMIVKLGGGDTDTSRNYVYTDWEAVDQFGKGFARQFIVKHFDSIIPR